MVVTASAILLSSFSFILINAEQTNDSRETYFVDDMQYAGIEYFNNIGLQVYNIDTKSTIYTINARNIELVYGTNTTQATINTSGTITAKLNTGDVKQVGTIKLRLVDAGGNASFMACVYNQQLNKYECGSETGDYSMTTPVYGPVGTENNINTQFVGTLSEDGTFTISGTENGSINVNEHVDGTISGKLDAIVQIRYKYSVPWYKFKADAITSYNSKQRIIVNKAVDYYIISVATNSDDLIKLKIYHDDGTFESISSSYRNHTSEYTMSTFVIDRGNHSGAMSIWFEGTYNTFDKITPIYFGNRHQLSEEMERYLLGQSTINNRLLEIINNLQNGNQQTSNEVQKNDVTNQAFDAQMQEYNQIESGHLDSFQTNISKISPSSYGFDKFGTDISKTANFVKVNFEKLIDNQFGNLLGFSLILGLALLMLGRRL